MRTIQATFAAVVLMIAAYWLYMVSDYIVLWSRRVMFLAGLGVRVCGVQTIGEMQRLQRIRRAAQARWGIDAAP